MKWNFVTGPFTAPGADVTANQLTIEQWIDCCETVRMETLSPNSNGSKICVPFYSSRHQRRNSRVEFQQLV